LFGWMGLTSKLSTLTSHQCCHHRGSKRPQPATPFPSHRARPGKVEKATTPRPSSPRERQKETLRPLSPPGGGGAAAATSSDPISNPQQLWQRERPLRASSTRARGLMRHLNPVGQRGARRTRVWFAVRHLSFRDCLVLLFNVVAPTHPRGILTTSTTRPGGLHAWVCPRDCPR